MGESQSRHLSGQPEADGDEWVRRAVGRKESVRTRVQVPASPPYAPVAQRKRHWS